ncbi:MAG: MBL fold metallo-hydrolase [Solirubrobacteraceae bacterium]
MSQVKNRDPVWLRRGVACLAAVLSVTAPLCLAGAAVAKPQLHDVIRSASKNPGSVNTLLIRAPRGLVIIDGGRNRAGGRRAVRQSRGTGERVAAILITHAHPDHVGGLGELHRAFPHAPIYASRQTAKIMRTDPLGFYPLARRDDPDFPRRLTYPTRTVRDGRTLNVGGLHLRTAEFGPGESQAATVYYQPRTRTLFSGDLTANHATPALIEGHSCGWLRNLVRLDRRFPHARTIYPGHGAPGRAHVQIARQRNYLKTFRRLVRPAISPSSAGGSAVTTGERASIIKQVKRRYPHYPRVAALPTLLQANIAAVARELDAEDPTTRPATCRP